MKTNKVLAIAALASLSLVMTGCIDEHTSYKITGGGQIVDCDGHAVTVAFTAQPTGEWCHGLIAKGQLQLVDHGSGIIFHGVVGQADGVECKKRIVWDDGLQCIVTDYIYYGGCKGLINYPDCPKPEPVEEFELTVSVVEGCDDALVCVEVRPCGKPKIKWSGVLEVGNITVHDQDGDLD